MCLPPSQCSEAYPSGAPPGDGAAAGTARLARYRPRVAAPLSLFAACPPGLEPLLADELRALGAAPAPAAGGVAFAADLRLLLAAHLWLSTASHLLLRCGELSRRVYDTGVKVSAQEMTGLNIHSSRTLAQWNYTLLPRQVSA